MVFDLETFVDAYAADPRAFGSLVSSSVECVHDDTIEYVAEDDGGDDDNEEEEEGFIGTNRAVSTGPELRTNVISLPRVYTGTTAAAPRLSRATHANSRDTDVMDIDIDSAPPPSIVENATRRHRVTTGAQHWSRQSHALALMDPDMTLNRAGKLMPTCTGCKKKASLAATRLCHACGQKEKKKEECSICGELRTLPKKKMCDRCYQQQRRKTVRDKSAPVQPEYAPAGTTDVATTNTGGAGTGATGKRVRPRDPETEDGVGEGGPARKRSRREEEEEEEEEEVEEEDEDEDDDVLI